MSRPPPYITPAEAARLGGPLRRRLIWWGRRAGQRLADLGAPPSLTGGRYLRHVPVEQAGQVEDLHPARRHPSPLPLNIGAREDLSDDPGWWGFSMRDVPDRPVAPLRIVRIEKARVLAGRTPDDAHDFFPAILDAEDRSVDLREIRFRPFHAPLVRKAPDLTLDRAIWVAERVFDNHSHWLSAHLPKLVMLRDRGLLEDGTLVLPADRPAVIDASLRAIGIDPDRCHRLGVGQVLAAGTLTLVSCDRFDPALLDAARAAFLAEDAEGGHRVLISRAGARGRKLVGEEAMMPALARRDFAAIRMETLDFAGQVRAMAGAVAVLAPHGAGLTNMLFCRPGTTIIEIADPDYPNPNFYAMAAALGLRYALVHAEGLGDGHPLHRDLAVDPDALDRVLETCL